MNTTLWTLQITMACALSASGMLILLLPKAKLASRLSWVNEYSDKMRYFICLSKIIGAIGLVVPLYLGTCPILTPLAAIGISLFMLLAMRYHLLHKEYKDIPATLVFFIIAVVIAYFRWI